PVTTGVEDGVVVFLLDPVETHRPVELGFGVRVLFEPTGDVGLESRLVALGIKWRTAALGRCEGNLRARILEDVVRRGELLQPKAGLSAGVAELVMRRQNHQDFHGGLLWPFGRDLHGRYRQPRPSRRGARRRDPAEALL